MKRVTITVNSDDYEAPGQLARNGDVSVSWLIRRSMREFLERHGKDGTIVIRPSRDTA